MDKRYCLPTTPKEFWNACDQTGECWFYKFSYLTKYQGRTIVAHRLAWEIANKKILSNKFLLVLHSCKSKFCVNPKHLYTGTSKDVESRRNTPKDFWRKVDKKTGPIPNRKLGRCWLWTGGQYKDGYGQACFHQKGYPAQRLAWLLTYGSLPKLLVCHKCDNPLCVRPLHLFLGTPKQNTDDMIAKGRWWGGTRKFTRKQRAEISVRMKGKQNRLGAVLSAETKAKIGEGNRLAWAAKKFQSRINSSSRSA